MNRAGSLIGCRFTSQVVLNVVSSQIRFATQCLREGAQLADQVRLGRVENKLFVVSQGRNFARPGRLAAVNHPLIDRSVRGWIFRMVFRAQVVKISRRNTGGPGASVARRELVARQIIDNEKNVGFRAEFLGSKTKDAFRLVRRAVEKVF